MEDIGQNLRDIMRVMGWKQARLAEELNTSQATVSRWISKVQEPDRASWVAITELHNKVMARNKPLSKVQKASGELAVKDLLRKIDGLPEEAIHPLWRMIAGFLEDAAQSEQIERRDQFEPAIHHREEGPVR